MRYRGFNISIYAFGEGFSAEARRSGDHIDLQEEFKNYEQALWAIEDEIDKYQEHEEQAREKSSQRYKNLVDITSGWL